MKKEEFENIVNLQNNLKEQPNSKLVEAMDILTTEFDLTKEKRYTLSNTSIQLAKKVNDRLFFKVYLEGDNLSSKFKRFLTLLNS